MPRAPARRMGTWKLAYADFLTALMAFFLVMWITQGMSADERTAIAAYFKPEIRDGAVTPDLLAGQHTLPIADLRARFAEDIAAGQVSVVRVDDTLKLELMDRSSAALFASASGQLTPRAERLLTTAATVLSAYPGPIAIEGHTDAFPSGIPGRSNWDISSDRALAAQRWLVANGIDEHRIAAVTGLAATSPLNPGEPHLSANRRISILLLPSKSGE